MTISATRAPIASEDVSPGESIPATWITRALVPAWMIVVAWEQLCKNGTLSHIELLHDLKVMRSAFVCALLAQFPDVVVVQDRPAVLERISAQ